MNLTAFLNEQHIDISGLALNSQTVQPGELFIAIGEGKRFISQAIQKGAVAVLSDAPVEAFSVPVWIVPDVKDHLATWAKLFYHEVDLDLIGVTGTNGKTTTCYLLGQALTQLGISCGVIGTLGVGFIPHLHTATLTTPDIFLLQRILKNLKAEKAEVVAMEVSSHGLSQDRVADLRFQSAIFTNLTQDHLDYHGTMQAYGEAKQKLFRMPLARAIMNGDAPFAQEIRKVLSPHIPFVLTSLTKQLSAPFFIQVKAYRLDQKGIWARLLTSWGEGELKTTLWGEFNLNNLLGVVAELCMRGISLEAALAVLEEISPPPGRMQLFGGEGKPRIIVDYAHTPDALENALKTAQLYRPHALWCVFGCGGDRDKEKRPQMGKIADAFADKIILTNDNPRGEAPKDIIEGILKGITDSTAIQVEESREAAIGYAIHHAHPDDIIVIAGKGHETYQWIGNEKHDFSDAACVQLFLKEREK